MNWIKCSERMPTEQKRYICYNAEYSDDYRVWIAHYDGNNEFMADDGCYYNVTHWMHKPPAPGKE